MTETPTVYKILNNAYKDVEIDTEEDKEFNEAFDELQYLHNRVKGLEESLKATQDALYNLQFVQHEDLLNKYCKLRDTLKTLMSDMGYKVEEK